MKYQVITKTDIHINCLYYNKFDLKLLWFGLFSCGFIFTHFHFKTTCGILKIAHFKFRDTYS